MKIENKLKYKVIIYLLLFLFAICISFHLIIYAVPYAQEIQDSSISTINNEYENSGDGNNNSLIDTNRKITKISNHIISNSKFDLLSFISGILTTVILYIQISELYFNEQDYLLKCYERSLIAEKIRLNI